MYIHVFNYLFINLCTKGNSIPQHLKVNLSCELNLGMIVFHWFQNDIWLKRIETHMMEMMKLDVFLVDMVGDGT